MNKLLCAAVAAFSLAVIGCGSSQTGPALGTVSGRITLDRQPVANAMVEFTPVQEGRPSSGRSDSSGHYTLQFTTSTKGAIVGEHTVKLSTFQPGFDSGGAEGFENVASRAEEIPKKYAKEPLRVTVKQGSNTIDLTLESGK